MPQSAICGDLFRTPIPAIPHLDLFSFNPEEIEKCSDNLHNLSYRILGTEKKVVSSMYAVYKD